MGTLAMATTPKKKTNNEICKLVYKQIKVKLDKKEITLKEAQALWTEYVKVKRKLY